MPLDTLTQYIPMLIPLVLIQLILIIAGLYDLFHHEKTRGPKWVWVLVILFVNIIGPIIYFVLGREDE